MATIEPAAGRILVARARVGRLGTVTAEGRPHLVPCCFAMVGDTIVSVVDGKPKSTGQLRRLDNIRAQPAASLLVDFYSDTWSQLWWVRVDGRARVLDSGDPVSDDPASGDPVSDDPVSDDPESGDEYEVGVDALVEKYPQYQADRPTGALIVIEIDRVTGWSSTDQSQDG